MNPPTDLIMLTTGVWIDPALLPDTGPSTGSVDRTESSFLLRDDHPMWDHASGGDRNAVDRQWTMSDLAEAAITLEGIKGKKAGAFFDLLLEQPGRLFTADEIIELTSGAFASPYAIAGSLNGFRKHAERAERVFPFYWWEGSPNGTPTRYAIRPSVAAVFDAAARR